jgi:cellulose synthase/poly-beta-1,6-N-acetylglucosamine synthase-like glycosyltransferase
MSFDVFATLAVIGVWTSLLTIAYVYAGYPLTLWLLPGRARHATGHPSPSESLRAVSAPECQPTVTVVIAAFNEAAHIGATVQNKLDQDYPAHLLDVIVVSDGSTDGTDDIVASIGGARVTLIRQDRRQGKTLALNRALAAARGEIIVFSDANSRYEPPAVTRLVAALDDPQVGYVTGRLNYEDPGQTATGGGSGLYIRYENWLRQLETRVGSVVGVNGGIDAVRRRLYAPMRADHLPDFVLPLRVVAQGYRVIYRDDAVAHEAALGHHADEFRMRVRVSLRAFHALVATRALLHPRHGLFAFQLLVHKVLRYLLIVPLATALLCSALLGGSPAYGAIFGAQITAYALAAIGWFSGGKIRLRVVFVPFYFSLINIAAGAALLSFLRGERHVLWTPRKGV